MFLDTQLDDELRDLGFVRELQNRIQTIRKEMGLEYTDRIRVGVGGSERVRRVVERYRDALAAEVLAAEVSWGTLSGVHERRRDIEVDVEGERVGLGVVAVA